MGKFIISRSWRNFEITTRISSCSDYERVQAVNLLDAIQWPKSLSKKPASLNYPNSRPYSVEVADLSSDTLISSSVCGGDKGITEIFKDYKFQWSYDSLSYKPVACNAVT